MSGSVTAEPDQRDEARRRARAAIGQHGRNTTSFQALEPGLCYWFEPDSQACVAYADTGRAWIAVGDPMAAPERLAEVAERFVVAARGRGRRVRFFAAEGEWMGAAGLDRMHIGT
ncbi:MAG: phosphatidylglycerol lysyltransferase domain-containing protein, partial [Myxococcota bacterium]